jgi:hypothetical protein
MNNNTTNKKKLELKKTAIANLTLSEAQMKMLIGGGAGNGITLSKIPPQIDGVDQDTNCTSKDPAQNPNTI